MSTSTTIAQAELADKSAPDYRLVMRHRGDGHQLCEWREYEGRRMDYRLARKFLLGVERLLPSLHKAGHKYYLVVEPIRGGAL